LVFYETLRKEIMNSKFQMSTPPLLLTVTEASKLLRLSRLTIYFMIEDGILEGIKIGAHWRIKTASVQKLIPDSISAAS